MSDVLFRYLLTARQRERSRVRRYFLADDPLLEAGIEELVETAAARVGITSQHENVSQREVTVPASQHRSVRFYQVAQPNRPREGHFERRTEEFPLEGTRKIFTCPTCTGSGKVRCWSCSGDGAVSCSICGGSGRVQDSSGRRRTCGSCGGSGRQTCGTCRGSGRVTCGKCRGEGRLASWEVEVYQWLIETRSGDQLPLVADEGRVRKAFDRWLKINPEAVVNFEPKAVASHLGFETPETLDVSARADAHRLQLEEKARNSRNRFMFLRADCAIAPVGYTLVRLADNARFYWLVGRGDKALEVKPRGRPDGVKFMGWLGAGSGGAMAWEGLEVAFDQALPLIESLQLLGEPPSLGFFVGSAASWLLTAAGVRRVRARKPPVPAIGLIVASGRPTAFLTCLAYLGSYLGHLRVLDRAYDMQSERLLGRMRPNRQSESLGIELADGRRVRLVEVANPRGLSTEKIRLMARALDAVMILEQPDQHANDLKAQIASAARPAPKIGTLVIDDTLDLGSPQPTLPLEAVRRAFVEDVHGNVDWQALFDRMWQPLAALIEPADGQEKTS